jgi:hypothetical protein
MLSQHEADTLAEARKVLRDLYYQAQRDNSDGKVAQYNLGMVASKCEAAREAVTALLIQLNVTQHDKKAKDALRLPE